MSNLTAQFKSRFPIIETIGIEKFEINDINDRLIFVLQNNLLLVNLKSSTVLEIFDKHNLSVPEILKQILLNLDYVYVDLKSIFGDNYFLLVDLDTLPDKTYFKAKFPTENALFLNSYHLGINLTSTGDILNYQYSVELNSGLHFNYSYHADQILDSKYKISVANDSTFKDTVLSGIELDNLDIYHHSYTQISPQDDSTIVENCKEIVEVSYSGEYLQPFLIPDTSMVLPELPELPNPGGPVTT